MSAGVPSRRLLLIAGATAAAVLLATGIYAAVAGPHPPSRSATRQLASLATARPVSLSGTLVATSTLTGAVAPGSGSGGRTSGIGLRSGKHSVRYWATAADAERMTVIEPGREIDYVRHGEDVWTFDSSTRVATRSASGRVTVAGAGAARTAAAAIVPVLTSAPVLTPAQIARWAASASGSDTTVTGGRGPRVAGRSTYRLRLTPPSRDGLRVTRVVLDLDVDTSTVLSAQVFGHDADGPALSVTFTDVRFAAPSDVVFAFVPPAGAQRRTVPGATAFDAVGRGWFTVLRRHGVPAAAVPPGAVAVHGSWGHGYRSCNELVCMVRTSDGRMTLGATSGDALTRALAGA